jgi:hypothetical protein
MTEAAPGRGGESEQEDWEAGETAVAFLWLSNHEPSYLEAIRRVEAAGNYFDGADALQEWVEDENPLKDLEPSLYSGLLAYAISGINWEELAEDFAPESWTAPKDPGSPADSS